MATADVTVFGAGIFGLSVAYACLRRGAAVQVIDPGGPGAGASGGVVGALAPHVPENWNDKKAFQLDSLLMAGGLWADVADLTGRDPGYARGGRLQPVADDAGLALARARAVTAAELWGDAALWEVVPARGAPWEPASPSGWLIRDTLSARVHPRRATLALAAAVEALGAAVLREGVTRGAVVWATGAAGLAELSAQAGRMVGTGVKGQAALLEFDAGEAPQLYADGLHVVPHADGTVAIGSTSEREFDDGAAVDGQVEMQVERVRAAVPALREARVIGRWAGVRPRARSRAPMLGPHPFLQGAYVANGGFKIGFGMAPKVGAVMADLVLEGRDAIPEGFRVEANL